ncbi:MAG: SRPBCC family protein [Chlamydiota bacterium]
MKIYRLKRIQRLPFPVTDVFSFFEQPKNLEKLTPHFLQFQTLTPTAVKMDTGAVIDYVLKVWSFPIRWTTLITDYHPPYSFIDLQLKGPYAYWHHQHSFEALDNRTIMKDCVTYALPLGCLGELFHRLKIESDLNKIFDYRAAAVLKHLKKISPSAVD